MSITPRVRNHDTNFLIEFQVEGRPYRFRDTVHGVSAYGLKSQPPILYDPRNPTRAKLDGRFQLWGWPSVDLALGLFFLFLFFGSRSDRTSP